MPTNFTKYSARDILRSCRCEAVIFDMDGVLADNASFHIEGWKRLLAEHTGSEAPIEAIRETFGQTNDVIIPYLWRLVGEEVDMSRLPELSQEKESHYRDAARGRIRPLPGAETFLTWLARQGIPTAVGTSAPADNVSFLLGQFGWEGAFGTIVHRARFAAGKPAPDCFLKAANLLHTRPARSIVVEDSVHGLFAARQGGFPQIGIATGMEEIDLVPLARWILRDFRQLSF